MKKIILSLSISMTLLVSMSCKDEFDQSNSTHNNYSKNLLSSWADYGVTADHSKDAFYQYDERFELAVISVSSNTLSDSRFKNYDENNVVIIYDKIKKQHVGAFLVSSENVMSQSSESQYVGKLRLDFLKPSKDSFTLTGEYGILTVDYNKGKASNIDYLYTPSLNYQRTSLEDKDECRKITESGGALDCAGKKFEKGLKSSPIEETGCYIGFIFCLGKRVVDCYLTGCNPDGSWF